MLSALLNIFFPPVCPLCEEEIRKELLCGNCLAGFTAEKITSPACTVCGTPFTSAGPDHVCGECLANDNPFKEARSSFIYGGKVHDAVHSFKYGGKTILAGPLGRMMADTAASISTRPDLIVPVPLHKKRLKDRGFNQSLLLAREIARAMSVNVDYLNLERIRFTEQQVTLAIKERHANVAGAFGVKRPDGFMGRRVLLVDDVYTTGATIKECSKVLKKAGAEVSVVTLARAVMI